MSIFDPPTTFHEWLFHATKCGAISVLDIMDDVRCYGEALPAFMPTNGIVCQEMLERLERDGKARREPGGTVWKWGEGKPVLVKVVEKQSSLF